ncbi:MAG: IPT/TIG domain-containing protein, partial [Dehalococcoidia bacterium]|nr:IPT/TIG domain-containing protein [Dehalococcoidia bacterium]
MKVKVLASLLALCFLTVLILPAAAHAESLTLDPTSGRVGTDVKIPAFCQYGEGEYFLYWGDSNQLIQQGTISKMGCQPLVFEVPQSPRGKQMVTLKVGSKSFQKEFTVLGTISIGVKKGIVGTEVAVKGDGFDARETGIKIIYNSNEAASGIEANAGGSWLYTLKIPASNRGNHSISASGSTTPSSEIKEQIFTVTPSFSINPNSGWVGRVVTVSGAGFGGGETNIAVIYDDIVVKTNISADLNGSWQSSFSIPASSKGTHKVDAKGATTALEDVPDAVFTVSPGIRVEQASGRLGDIINTGDTLYV